ncbi:MAG: N-acetylglucosamine-6-phosphate deacetylase [Proteobacteria bacterium]|nr:N-acetylglucosamine-6-phosphate deacetylase [Pseudomonadota bacterium]
MGPAQVEPYAICCATLFDGEHFIPDHCVIVESGKISDIIPLASLPNGIARQQLRGGILAPGFIDLQVNGGGGVMLSSTPIRETVDTMTAAHRRYGTTGMLPTLLSDSRPKQQACVRAVQDALNAGNAGVLGVHIEGPFFDLNKRGAHKASKIREPKAVDIEWLCSLELPSVIVTLAPEHVLPGQIRQLAAAGIHVCAGHSNASYQEVVDAIGEGLRGFTHLYNAMSPLTSREPGVVGAALDCPTSWVGIIADGHHVHQASIRIAHKVKPRGKVVLISDAMATVGSSEGCFEIYGETIKEKEGHLTNAEGVLAGSAIGMIDAVRIATEIVGIPMDESLRMAALYPAEFLQRETELGRIAIGFRADFVHFDNTFKVLGTWVEGQHQTHDSPPLG